MKKFIKVTTSNKKISEEIKDIIKKERLGRVPYRIKNGKLVEIESDNTALVNFAVSKGLIEE